MSGWFLCYNTVESSASFYSSIPKVYLLHGRAHSPTALSQWNRYNHNENPESVLNIQCVFIKAKGPRCQVPSRGLCNEWDTNKTSYCLATGILGTKKKRKKSRPSNKCVLRIFSALLQVNNVS